jgi:hypothetical protein
MKDLNQIEKHLNEVQQYFDSKLKSIQEDIAKLKEPELKFKIGQWYKYGNDLFRVYKIYENEVHYDNRGKSLGSNFFIFYSQIYQLSCIATPQEIESHLRKICDEKYIGKNVAGSFLGQHDGYARSFDFYDFASDSVYYKNFGYGVCVYSKGKFAEIISDKKKLPKNRDEFVDFLTRFRQLTSPEISVRISEFLNDYES